MTQKVVSILGCGWLGKALGKVLVADGYVVKGSTTHVENILGLQAIGIRPFVFDVDGLASGSVGDFFETDVLIISLPPRSRAGKAEEYVKQIRKVVDAARTANVSKILLISTTGVYPNLNRVVTEEDADVDNPIAQAEDIVRNSGIPNTILRFGGLFGPGRHPGKFLAGKKDVSGGNAPVNMIHLDDCVSVITSIINKGVWNEVMSACADEHPTKREFYSKAAKELGVKAPVFSERDIDFKIVSSERMKELLHYKFIHRLC